jgi:hypothetical protein
VDRREHLRHGVVNVVAPTRGDRNTSGGELAGDGPHPRSDLIYRQPSREEPKATLFDIRSPIRAGRNRDIIAGLDRGVRQRQER